MGNVVVGEDTHHGGHPLRQTTGTIGFPKALLRRGRCEKSGNVDTLRQQVLRHVRGTKDIRQALLRCVRCEKQVTLRETSPDNVKRKLKY